MPTMAELVEAQRQKRRAQLDQILKGSAPQQTPLNFQPVGLPQAEGSKILGYFLGSLGGQAPQPGAVQQTTPQAQAGALTFPAQSPGASPASGTPGGSPLSPAPNPAPKPSALSKLGGAAQDAIKNTALYKALAAIFL